MEVVTALLLTVAVAAFVAWPLFRQAPSPEMAVAAELSPLERQKLEAYAAIKEAEFDHQMGKLTDSDFEAIREKYSRQAITAMAAMESAGARTAGRARGKLQTQASVRIAYCPSCGGKLPPLANFCPSCGCDIKAFANAAA